MNIGVVIRKRIQKHKETLEKELMKDCMPKPEDN